MSLNVGYVLLAILPLLSAQSFDCCKELVNPQGALLNIKVNSIVAGSSITGSTYPLPFNVAAGTASQSIVVGHSGYVVLVPQVTASVTLTLPTLASVAALSNGGLFTTKVIFKAAGDGSHGVTIACPDGAHMIGYYSNAGTPTAKGSAGAVTNLIWSGANGVGGEAASLICNGTSWFFEANSATASVFSSS